MEHRVSDQESRTWFRSDRLFRSNGSWFFHTREGIAVGPYKSQFEAEIDVGMLKTLLEDVDAERALMIVRAFMLDAEEALGGLNADVFTDYLIEEGEGRD